MTEATVHLDGSDHERLHAQTSWIVERLRQGPATNAELAAIGLKYTSRVSEARRRGHHIACRRLGGGLTRYELVGAGE